MQVKMKRTITHNNMLFSKNSIYSKDLFLPDVFERLDKAGVFSPVNSTEAVKKEAPKNDHANFTGETDNLVKKNDNLQKKAALVDEKPVIEKEEKEEKEPEKAKKGKK